ncbi:uncharacterized protein FMAN_15479 [Fusarium mangiferae]|uniref:Uncharacterized protein n=1 Tax=Fusarium mangiferae TaxID=192010 RepID=A0A1L7UMK2_FUSMA|nr:uncharacterized protein FMAN_15479 [Fusarium mangiferae]CVL09315.1 uncharacterized protein FMAN_15479 [Fusarium mangiferae]
MAPETLSRSSQSSTGIVYRSDVHEACVSNAYKLLKNRFNDILRKNDSLEKSQKLLQRRTDHASRDNRRLRRELNRQQNDCKLLTKEIKSISAEKSQLYAQLEEEKFQKQLGDVFLQQCLDEIGERQQEIREERSKRQVNDLMVDRCRDKIEKQKLELEEKENHLRTCKEAVVVAYSEISMVKAQNRYLEQRLIVGEDNISELNWQLERKNGETARLNIIVAKLEKERSEAMDGCYYLQGQIGKLKTTTVN